MLALLGNLNIREIGFQVVGVEGYNPSGHCLITSKVVDSLPYIPEGDLPPAKKLAMDQDFVTSSPSGTSKRLSLVCPDYVSFLPLILLETS